ncbi:TetR/AcrR family transcriptional regulator [Cryptosporangium sp. NPDC051539]|uniref:TetR/AcrR family transcriptional regulator n=1 Tax=Cryptosporangium sp. NPDC051539 TaxID=3363962 RepID=UPI00379E25BC
MVQREVSPRRGQARTDAILDAALELVEEVGYSRASVDAIAIRARASKMTVYRRWPNKAELVAEALRRQSEGSVPRIADTGSLRSDLIATVEAIVLALHGGSRTSLLSLTEAVREDPNLRDLIRAQIEDRCAVDAAVICENAAARGERVDPGLGPLALRITVAHLFTTTLLHGQPPAEPERTMLVDAVLLPMLHVS